MRESVMLRCLSDLCFQKRRSVVLQCIVTLTHLNRPASLFMWLNNSEQVVEFCYIYIPVQTLYTCTSVVYPLGQKWPQLKATLRHTRWWVVRMLNFNYYFFSFLKELVSLVSKIKKKNNNNKVQVFFFSLCLSILDFLGQRHQPTLPGCNWCDSTAFK